MPDDTTPPRGFSEQERDAMRQRAAELKAEAARSKQADKAAAEEAEVLAKIAAMPPGDRELAERIHAIVDEVAPSLRPKLYYGQPGYADRGKVVVFFRSGQMDRLRYSTFGLSVHAALDDPTGLWATSYALIDPTAAAWQRIRDVVQQAAG